MCGIYTCGVYRTRRGSGYTELGFIIFGEWEKARGGLGFTRIRGLGMGVSLMMEGGRGVSAGNGKNNKLSGFQNTLHENMAFCRGLASQAPDEDMGLGNIAPFFGHWVVRPLRNNLLGVSSDAPEARERGGEKLALGLLGACWYLSFVPLSFS